jgi:chromosome segregation ATPase
MWDAAKQQQLDELRARAEHSALPPDEQRTLDQLLAELEQQEWSALRPALDALRQEQGQLQADIGHLQVQNAVLAALAERCTDLIARARLQLAGLTEEREALRTEYDRVLQS